MTAQIFHFPVARKRRPEPTEDWLTEVRKQRGPARNTSHVLLVVHDIATLRRVQPVVEGWPGARFELEVCTREVEAHGYQWIMVDTTIPEDELETLTFQRQVRQHYPAMHLKLVNLGEVGEDLNKTFDFIVDVSEAFEYQAEHPDAPPSNLL